VFTPVVVAEITNDAMLGMDFLHATKCTVEKKKEQLIFGDKIVTEDGIATDPENIRVIQEWATPTCLKEVRAFLGLASYYGRYVKDFSDTARPLYNLTQKNVAFNWTDQCEEAFYMLKRCLTTSPVLAYPEPIGQLELDTDASAYGIGAVLSQERNGRRELLHTPAERSQKPRGITV
jgi:hypothetical protein